MLKKGTPRIRGSIKRNDSELKTRSKGLSHWLYGDQPYLGLHLEGLGMEKSLAGSKLAPVRIRGPIMPNDSELKTRSKGLSHWLYGDQPYLGLHLEGLGMEKSLAGSKLAPVRIRGPIMPNDSELKTRSKGLSHWFHGDKPYLGLHLEGLGMEKSLACSKLAPVRIRGPIMPNDSELKTRSKGLSHWLHGDKPYLGLHLEGLGMEKSLAGSKLAPVRIRGPIMPNDSELKTKSKGLFHWLHGDKPYLGLHLEGLGMEKSLAGSKLAPVRIRGPIMPNDSELKTRSKGLSHWLHGDKPYLGLHLEGLGMEKSLACSKLAPVRIRGPIMPNDSELKTRSKGLSHWLHGDKPYLATSRRVGHGKIPSMLQIGTCQVHSDPMMRSRSARIGTCQD